MFFRLGNLVCTPGALEACAKAATNPILLIARHVNQDPGILDEHDQHVNREAIMCGGRILSAYLLPTEERIWVITEADRLTTTILLPDEY
jgi:hypothetical protein